MSFENTLLRKPGVQKNRLANRSLPSGFVCSGSAKLQRVRHFAAGGLGAECGAECGAPRRCMPRRTRRWPWRAQGIQPEKCQATILRLSEVRRGEVRRD